MNKALLTLSVLVLLAQAAWAQYFAIGPRVGLNWAGMTNTVEAGQSRELPAQYSLGITTRMRFDDISVIAEVNYEQKGFKVGLGDAADSYERMRNDYLEVPVLIRYDVFSTEDISVYAEGGIYAAYLLSSLYEKVDTIGVSGVYVKTSANLVLSSKNTNQLFGLYDAGPVLGAGISHYFAGGNSDIYAGFRINYGLIEAMRYTTGTGNPVRSLGSDNFVMSFSIGYFFDNFSNEKRIRFRHGPYY